MTKPTICHLGAWGKNWGDRAILYALQSAVGCDEYEWWNVDIQRDWTYGGDGRTPDLILIGGGGLLWDKPELKSPSGWQWQIAPEHIESLAPPIIVHAIGDTRFPHGDDQTGIKPEFKESLTILSEKAVHFSVRDELTQRILKDLDISTSLCPDPALFIGEPRTELPSGPPVLGVCLAWDKAPWRWPGHYQGAATFVEYMDALAEALRGFVKEGWQLRPFCHIPEDYPTVEFCERLGNVSWGWYTNEATSSVGGLANQYAECAAAVSMRKHGIIIPAGLGVPVVGLGDMAEVGSICEQLGTVCVTSATASPEAFTQAINRQMDLYPLPGRTGIPESIVYRDLRAAHDRHISRIRGVLA